MEHYPDKERGHTSCPLFLAPISSLIAFIFVCFFNFLAQQDANNLHWGVFKNNTGDISDAFYLEITPAGWTFSIWGFIYAYQVIMLVYWLTLLCRKNPSTNEPLCRSPVFMSPWIGFFYVLNMALNITWLLVWDRQKVLISFVVLALTALTLYICIGISMYGIAKNRKQMMKQGLSTEIKLVIGIVQNGLGMYAAWTTIATLLNFAMVLTYDENIGIDQHISSTIALCVLAFEVVVYAFVDNIFLEKHTRYLFTPYIVLHIALIGSVTKNWDSSNPNSILTAALLVIGPFVTIMKIILVIYRTIRKPLFVPPSMEAI